jgi:hypothetical protein
MKKAAMVDSAVGGLASKGLVGGMGLFSAIGGMGGTVGPAPQWDSELEIVDGPVPLVI